MPDGSTYISVLTAVFTVDGTKIVDLPAGTYRVAITTATAVQGAVNVVPSRTK
mgnify:CR=1 FL=1